MQRRRENTEYPRRKGKRHQVCDRKKQRLISPRLFDAVLRMLKMKALAEAQGKDISQFVLGYSDAFWQIAICADELQFFCATAILDGKRQYLVFLRAAQGSMLAPLLWARLAARRRSSCG